MPVRARLRWEDEKWVPGKLVTSWRDASHTLAPHGAALKQPGPQIRATTEHVSGPCHLVV